MHQFLYLNFEYISSKAFKQKFKVVLRLEAVVLEAVQERNLTLATNPILLHKNPLIYK